MYLLIQHLCTDWQCHSSCHVISRIAVLRT